MWMNKNFRHFPNGVVWDPRGKYIVTLSTDRRMDILDAVKGTRLRSCHSIDFPATEIGGILLPANVRFCLAYMENFFFYHIIWVSVA